VWLYAEVAGNAFRFTMALATTAALLTAASLSSCIAPLIVTATDPPGPALPASEVSVVMLGTPQSRASTSDSNARRLD